MREITLAEAVKITGAKPRTIQNWTINDVIKCKEETKHLGPGAPRLYPPHEVAIAAVLRRASEISLSIGELKEIACAIRCKVFPVAAHDIDKYIEARKSIVFKYEHEFAEKSSLNRRIVEMIESESSGKTSANGKHAAGLRMLSKSNVFMKLSDELESIEERISTTFGREIHPYDEVAGFVGALFPKKAGDATKVLARHGGDGFEGIVSTEDAYIIIMKSDEGEWCVYFDYEGVVIQNGIKIKTRDWGNVLVVNMHNAFRGIE